MLMFYIISTVLEVLKACFRVFFVSLRVKIQMYIYKILSEYMKKSLLLICLCIGGCLFAGAQSQKSIRSEIRPSGETKAENYAEIKFDTLRCDLGIFPEADPVRKYSFTFTNVGTAPLIVNQAFASCGCTVPTFTKEPIKPGDKGSIDVTYNGKGLLPGRFSKTITVRTNAKNRIVRLIVEGEMTE